MRPVASTPADKPAKDLLFELLRSRRQMAIVHDDGHLVGLVTLEDLLEELVGDIRDEHDDSNE
jgi:putative hemolysin